MLPKLVKWGFDGKIYGTKATIELTKVMLEDAININETYDTETIKNMKFHEFDKNRGENTFKGFGKYHKIENNFSVAILRSSHVLGSCTWLFRWSENEDDKSVNEKEWKYIYFTGDIGSVRGDVNTNILFKEHQIPFSNSNKIVIMESTYGEIVRSKKDNIYEDKITRLAEIIFTNIQNNGFVLIPAFALDRAQQILVDLYYIDAKYKIKDKRLYEIIGINCNWDTILFNKNKDNIIESLGNLISLNKKCKKNLKSYIDKIFNNEDIPFQNVSIERRQKFISFLKGKIGIKIGIKSPLIKKINDIYLNHLTDDVFSNKEKKSKYKYLSDDFLCKFDIEHSSSSSEKTEKIKEILKKCFERTEDGNIVVSASGMCDEGAILELLQRHLKDENSTIILTGYQGKNTNGFLLKNYSEGKYDEENRKDEISLNKIDMKLSNVKCKIEDLSEYYSAHADQEQLVNYIIESNKNSTKTTILLNHGTEKAQKKLKEILEQKGGENISVLFPEFNKWFDIGSEKYNSEETDKNDEIMDFETVQQYINIDKLHIYFPIEYDKSKMIKIIEYIKNL